MKKILGISDLHCGHHFGLTPPSYQYHPSYKDRQAQLWGYFMSIVDTVKPDILFVVGDMIDGQGKRSGGVELLSPDMQVQAEIALECLKSVSAKKVILTYGTPYHTASEGMEFENLIAKELNAEIHDHALVDVEDVRFSLKHKIGSSGIPHGRATALLRDALWDSIWAMKGYEDRKPADVLLRGHVHYHSFAGNANSLAMTLPCLQLSSSYGSRQCQGTIDFGAVSFVVDGDTYSWKTHIAKLHQRHITKL